MGRCPKKLQGGSRKSVLQKVISSFLILPLRYSRRRRARPSLPSRHPQNRSRRRMPPPPRRRRPPLRLRRRPPRQLVHPPTNPRRPQPLFPRPGPLVTTILPPRCRARLPLALTQEEWRAALLTREPHSPEWRSGMFRTRCPLNIFPWRFEFSPSLFMDTCPDFVTKRSYTHRFCFPLAANG